MTGGGGVKVSGFGGSASVVSSEWRVAGSGRGGLFVEAFAPGGGFGVEFAPFGAVIAGGGAGWFSFGGGLFGAEFEVVRPALGGQSAGGKRGLDGAAGFGDVGAVGEAAAEGEGGDVVEGVVDGLGGVPELEFAHAGGVDEEGAGGGEDEFAAGGGVAAFAIFFADLAGGQGIVAGEGVNEGGFADAGGADEREGAARAVVGGEGLEAASGGGAGDEDGDAGGEGFDLVADAFGIGTEVGFIEHDDGLGAALAGGDDEALDAFRVVVAIEAGDEEDGVDVGGDDLLDVLVAGGAAGEFGAAGEEDVEIGAGLAGAEADADPIADGGELIGPGGVVKEAAAALGEDLAAGGLDGVEFTAQFADDAGGLKPFGGMGRKELREGIGPAVGGEPGREWRWRSQKSETL